MYILSFISILGWIFFLSLHFRKYASYIPFFVVTSIMLVLYLSGAVGALQYVNNLILVLGLSLLCYVLIKKPLLKKIGGLPLSFFMLAILGIIWFVFTKNAVIFGWDEFAWGQFTKVIVNSDAIYTANSAIMDGKLNYPPGISLFQYFFSNLGGYSEPAIYFSQGIFVFTAILLVFDFTKMNFKRLILFGLAVSMALVYFGPGLLSMTNDHIIGVAFANAILANFYLLRSNKSKLLLIPIVFSIPLIKTTGIVLSGAIVIAIIVDIIMTTFSTAKLTKIKPKFLAPILITLVLIIFAILPVKMWNNYLLRQGVLPNPTPKISNVMKSFTKEASLREKIVFRNFSNALVDLPINGQDGDIKLNNPAYKIYSKFLKIVNRPGLSTIDWLFFFSAFFIAVLCFQKKEERPRYLSLYLALLLGCFLYLFMHLLAYMYYFSELEGVGLYSMGRYINSYFLGLALIAIGISSNLIKKHPEKAKPFGITACIFMVFLFIFHTPPLIQLIAPPGIMAKSTSVVRDVTKPFSKYINENTEEGSKIWLIYQNSNGWEAMMIRHDIVPRRMNGGSGNWSLGKKYGAKDVWTNELSVETWTEQVLGENYDYVYLARADDVFWNHYEEMFDDPLNAKSHTLFKVEEKDGLARLVAK